MALGYDDNKLIFCLLMKTRACCSTKGLADFEFPNLCVCILTKTHPIKTPMDSKKLPISFQRYNPQTDLLKKNQELKESVPRRQHLWERKKSTRNMGCFCYLPTKHQIQEFASEGTFKDFQPLAQCF